MTRGFLFLEDQDSWRVRIWEWSALSQSRRAIHSKGVSYPNAISLRLGDRQATESTNPFGNFLLFFSIPIPAEIRPTFFPSYLSRAQHPFERYRQGITSV